MNFDAFESLDNSRERKGGYTTIKEQNFDNLKYRKSEKKIKGKDGKANSTIMEGRFYLGKKRIKESSLLTNGLHGFNSPEGQFLGVVGIVDAQFLREPKQHKDETTGQIVAGKKSTSFTSPKLELQLEALKIIDTTKVGENQYINMTSVATSVTIKGVSVSELFKLSVGVAKKAVEPSVVEKLVASSSVAQSQPQAEPVVVRKGDWD